MGKDKPKIGEKLAREKVKRLHDRMPKLEQEVPHFVVGSGVHRRFVTPKNAIAETMVKIADDEEMAELVKEQLRVRATLQPDPHIATHEGKSISWQSMLDEIESGSERGKQYQKTLVEMNNVLVKE
jgi:hypothetical protein